MASGYYDATFKTYGNLMFYKGHAPDYFYFKSLQTYGGTTPEYAAKAAEIASAGETALANTPTFSGGEDMPALKMLSTALDFLRQAVQYERSNEMAYFKQKFAILKDSFSKEERAAIKEITELEDLFSHGASVEGFNYNRMITLINILEQGLKQTKVVSQYEAERINTIEKAMKDIRSSRKRQLNGLWRKMNGMSKKDEIDTSDPDYIKFIQRSEKKFNRQLTISYAEHGNLTSPYDSKNRKTIYGAKKYLANIPKTVDVVVAHWITDHIKEIFESEANMQQFEDLAKQYLLTGNANTSTIREMLVKSIVNDGVKHTVEILEGSYKNLPADEFIQTLSEQINETREYRIQGYYSNFGQYGRRLGYFDGKLLDSGKEAAKGLYTAYAALVKELSQTEHKTTREESQLMTAIKGQGKLQTYNRMISLIHRLEVKEKEFEKIQQQIREGRRKEEVTRSLNLGASGNGTDVIVKVKITSQGIEFIEAGETPEQDRSVSIGSKLNQTSLMKKIGNGRTEATSLKGVIMGLKSKMSRNLRDMLNEIIVKAMADPKNKRTESQITTAFEKALTGLKLSVGGPKLSEIAPAIINALQKGVVSTHFPGSLNRRNDLITITLTYNDINIETTLQEIMDKKAEDLAAKLDPEVAAIQKEYIANFESQFYQKMSKLKTTDSNFNSLAENEKIWFEYAKEQEKRMQEIEEMREKTDDMWGQYVAKARKEGKSEEEINEKRQAVLGSLQDSFFISDTMKTYNQYQNDLGFSGASLGANVHAQLGNLNTLFTKAGVPLLDEDITWLESAIINCSPVSIVGEKNKNIIENYLSSMAALAMFDEGSAEGQIIKDLSDKITERVKASPKILHLYRVNGIFVPGSVVLQRTIDELSKCLEQSSLAIETVTRGAGIEIINTMNEGLIPNRSTTSRRYQTFDTDPWGTVASATDSHVKLKIMFLAKLLDIVNDMNTLMSKVEIPG